MPNSSNSKKIMAVFLKTIPQSTIIQYFINKPGSFPASPLFQAVAPFNIKNPAFLAGFLLS